MRIRMKSLRTRLLLCFYILAIIPMIAIAGISLRNTIHIQEDNFNSMMHVNLEQINKNVNLTMDSYRDLLYQLYTDDTVIELVKDLNTGENLAVARSQLLRKVREVASLKPGIASVMIIPKDGDLIFFDKLTAASTKSSWVDNYPIEIEKIYRETINSNETIVFPTKFSIKIVDKSYYLFHAAHRIIDYRDVEKEIGVIIFSIDQTVLNEICNDGIDLEKPVSVNFLFNEKGEIMVFPMEEYLGGILKYDKGDEESKREACRQFLEGTALFKNTDVFINIAQDEKAGWSIVGVTDKQELSKVIDFQKKIILVIIVGAIAVLSIAGWLLVNQLTASIRKVVGTIQRVSDGNLSERVQIDKRMPEEIEDISVNFNAMLEHLEESIEKERIATDKQREAEIAFLEAQINPHFLYNTLDTINWMAIDEEQYEISDAVNSLAKILRYGIQKSNETVPVSREIEWLKQYIFLQQYRIKKEMDCRISVEPEVMDCQIHKLLLQPFVENAIKHGYRIGREGFCLEIEIFARGENLIIEIRDNGAGIGEERLRELQENRQSGQHIGVRNAIERIRIYYGEDAKVQLESKETEGMTVTIVFPKCVETGKDEDRNCGR